MMKVTICKCLIVSLGFVYDHQTEEMTDDDDHAEYIRTPGIDISQQSVSDAGEFVIWDCAGQKEYSITHGMFLGAIAHSIFLVLYDINDKESSQVTLYFLWCSYLSLPNADLLILFTEMYFYSRNYKAIFKVSAWCKLSIVICISFYTRSAVFWHIICSSVRV